MKSGQNQTSAQIYAFPVNRIVRSCGMRELEALERGELDHHVDVDSWYHQEAIEASPTISDKKQ